MVFIGGSISASSNCVILQLDSAGADPGGGGMEGVHVPTPELRNHETCRFTATPMQAHLYMNHYFMSCKH